MRIRPALVLAATALVAVAPAAEAKIIFTKVVSDPVVWGHTNGGSPRNDKLNAETITIKNTGTHRRYLTGWVVRDLAGNRYRFGRFGLCAGCRVVLHSGQGSNTAGHLYWGRTVHVWNDERDKATLLRGSTVVDTCVYPKTGVPGGPIPAPGGINGDYAC